MAPSAPSSSSSSADEPVYPHAMAASLAGLPVRIKQEDKSNAVESNANGGKAKSGELKDFLDLAVSFRIFTAFSNGGRHLHTVGS